MKQFVPLTDDMLYRPGGPPAALVPYHCGIACFHDAQVALVRSEKKFAMDTIKGDQMPWLRDAPSIYRRA